MKLNKFAFILAAFLMIAACGDKTNPETSGNGNGNGNQENVDPTPDPENPDPENPEPENPEQAELVLTFDFTNAEAMSGWPTVNTENHGEAVQISCPYTIDGVTYNFINAQPIGASGASWSFYSSVDEALVLFKSRYLGFPVVDEYKLTKVEFAIKAGTKAVYLIATAVVSDTDAPDIVTGGDEQKDESKTEFTFELSDTTPGTQYWLRTRSTNPRVTSMTLTYVK